MGFGGHDEDETLFLCGGVSFSEANSLLETIQRVGGGRGWVARESNCSLQSKGLSRVFSNTTVQKHQFFGAQPSSQSNSHIHT